jgi:hypothetical protein
MRASFGGAALGVSRSSRWRPIPAHWRDNVILTPYRRSTAEALEELQTKCASDVARVLRGEPPVYPA